jgi:hypothetical protein
MGVGSWLSRFLSRGLVARFISIELLVGLRAWGMERARWQESDYAPDDDSDDSDDD